MGDKGGFFLPESASTMAGEVDALFNFVNIVSLIIFILVIGAMLVFIVKYRARGENHAPAPLPEHKVVEAAWIVIPLVLCMIVFTWGFKTFLKLYTIPTDSYEVQVIGRQWAWEFRYDNGISTANELHVPVGRPVRLNMSSADVLHSFYVPAFRVKFDVLPDRYTSLWFEATREGEFDILCTEYCGLSHSAMTGKVVVHTEQEFNEWLLENSVGDLTPVEYGEQLYTSQACFACHTVDGGPSVGPTLLDLFGKTEQMTDGTSITVDENYLRESILDPAAKIVAGYQALMPATYAASLSAEQTDALIAYIASLQQ
jgi:cytochrome c oxidase subunit 2